ncbi:MAG: hypothetical protein WCI48_00195 [Bacteroidota bacterium]|jgi:hypothetical protein
MRKTRIAHLGIIGLFLIACTSPPGSYHKALAESPYDVIIVPGIPYQDQDWGSNVRKARVLWSFYLYSNRISENMKEFLDKSTSRV